MTDRPILFSAPMVRALLAGTKTQTRRLLKPQPNRLNGGHPLYDGDGSYSTENGWKRLPYAVGDRLWVREAGNWRGPMKDEIGGGNSASPFYAADSERGRSEFFDDKNRPGIFMPRWASRLTLTVTDVRVQRLQEIDAADAIAEGVRFEPGDSGPIAIYAGLWDSLNADRAPWASNPWVVAVTFEVAARNIDQRATS